MLRQQQQQQKQRQPRKAQEPKQRLSPGQEEEMQDQERSLRVAPPFARSAAGGALPALPGFSGMLFPFIAMAVGIVTLVIVYVLAVLYHPVSYWFISQMGSNKPAYYFYAWGCSFAAGLIVPFIYIFYLHNTDKLRCSASPWRNTLNKISLATGLIAAWGVSAQSVYPMGEGNPIHIAFASTFFIFIFLHTCVTSLMYWHALRDHKLGLAATERFWAKWKTVCSVLTAVFTALTCAVLGYDASFHFDDDWIYGPNIMEWLKNSHKGPKTMWMAGGAMCEYLTVASLLFYFISYFHDLRYVRLLVYSPVSHTKTTKGRR